MTDALKTADATADDRPINLLWTGGWDSTFRLLELVLIHAREVCPYYVINTNRASMRQEFKAMARIRRRIDEAAGGGLVHPTAVIVSEDFPPDIETRGQIRSLNAQGYLGTQYEWLAHVVKQYDLHGIELSVHVDDKAARFLEGQVRPVQDGTPRGSWELKEEAFETPLALFRHFRFPLLPLTKLEMEEIIRGHGFADILADTWFCHSRFTTPCGMCPPCEYALVEGMEHRIPRIRRSWPYRLGWKAAKAAQSLVHKVT